MSSQSLSLPYLVLSGTLVVALVVSIVLFRPQFTHWQAARAELETLQATVVERQSFLATIDQKAEELRKNASADQELNVLLPADESFDDVVRILDRLAGSAAVRILKVDNTTANTQAAARVAEALGTTTGAPVTLTTHSATVTVEGSYLAIRQFISVLENSARFTDISALALSPAEGQNDILRGSITLHFYSL